MHKYPHTAREVKAAPPNREISPLDWQLRPFPPAHLPSALTDFLNPYTQVCGLLGQHTMVERMHNAGAADLVGVTL